MNSFKHTYLPTYRVHIHIHTYLAHTDRVATYREICIISDLFRHDIIASPEIFKGKRLGIGA